MTLKKLDDDKVPFEEALNRTGFGKYNYMLTLLCGVTIISFACVAYSTTIIVPASACELHTSQAQQGMMAAAPLIGSIIGAFIWGYLGDTRGRHKMLIVSIILSIIINSLSSLSVNWLMLMILQFFATMMACGKYTLSVTLLSECVPLAHRNQVLLLMTCMMLVSQGLMAALAIPIIPLTFSYYIPLLGISWNSWRTMLVVYSVPSVFCLICLLFIQESPKFLFSKGEEIKALDVLKAIHKINHGEDFGELQVKGFLMEQSDGLGEIKSKKDQIVPLFKTPLLKNTVLVAVLYLLFHVGSFLIWLPTIANRVMKVIETGEGANLTLCGVLNLELDTGPENYVAPCALNVFALIIVLVVGALQAIINLVISMMVNRTGRRNMIMFLSSVLGACGVLINVVPDLVTSAIFFGIFMMGVVVLGLYTTIVVSLFPTHLRAMAVSLAAVFGRFGTFISIQVLSYLLRNHCEVGFYVFASMFTLSAAVVWFLPNDRLMTKPQEHSDKDNEKQF